MSRHKPSKSILELQAGLTRIESYLSAKESLQVIILIFWGAISAFWLAMSTLPGSGLPLKVIVPFLLGIAVPVLSIVCMVEIPGAIWRRLRRRLAAELEIKEMQADPLAEWRKLEARNKVLIPTISGHQTQVAKDTAELAANLEKQRQLEAMMVLSDAALGRLTESDGGRPTDQGLSILRGGVR